jgi:hypothetical protein
MLFSKQLTLEIKRSPGPLTLEFAHSVISFTGTVILEKHSKYDYKRVSYTGVSDSEFLEYLSILPPTKKWKFIYNGKLYDYVDLVTSGTSFSFKMNNTTKRIKVVEIYDPNNLPIFGQN